MVQKRLVAAVVVGAMASFFKGNMHDSDAACRLRESLHNSCRQILALLGSDFVLHWTLLASRAVRNQGHCAGRACA